MSGGKKMPNTASTTSSASTKYDATTARDRRTYGAVVVARTVSVVVRRGVVVMRASLGSARSSGASHARIEEAVQQIEREARDEDQERVRQRAAEEDVVVARACRIDDDGTEAGQVED